MIALTTAELQLIQDLRIAEAKKAEEAAKAARSDEDKAIEVFQKLAAANNCLALDLIVELNEKHSGHLTAIKINATSYSTRIAYKNTISSADAGFVNFGADVVKVSDKFGNSIEIKLKADDFDKNVYCINEDYVIGQRRYEGKTSKNAMRIAASRLKLMHEKQLAQEIKDKKVKNANAFLKEQFPKANKISFYFGDYGDGKYQVSEFEGFYEYNSVEGGITFNEDNTVKNYSYKISLSHSTPNPGDARLKELAKARAEAIAEINKKFDQEMIIVLNA